MSYEPYYASTQNVQAFQAKLIEMLTACVNGGTAGTVLHHERFERLIPYCEGIKAKRIFPDFIPILTGNVSSTQKGCGISKVHYREPDSVWVVNCDGQEILIANLSYATAEYSRIGFCEFGIILAKTKDAVTTFLKNYEKYLWDYKRNKDNKVKNYTGDGINTFRKMRWEDIFLADDLVKVIRSEVETFFKSESIYDQCGLDWKRGIMLAGKPGNGKTAVCRAIATSSPVPVVFCSLDDSDMFHIISSVEYTIKTLAPCVCIYEDADVLGGNEGLRSRFLNLLDGAASAKGVLTIASTNTPEKLDSAFTGRPSRFDSFYIFGDPGPNERMKILKSKLSKVAKTLSAKDFSTVVEETADLSAACVQEIAVASLLEHVKTGKPVALKGLLKGVEKMRQHLRASKNAENSLQKPAGFGTKKSRRIALGTTPPKEEND
jgi:hypothetical protein